MTDHGHKTEDLRHHAHARADPDTLEAITRRWGRTGIVVGLALCVGTVIESLMMADATEHGLFQSDPGRLFGLMGFVAQMMIGGFLIIAGTIEAIGRSSRENVRLVRVMVQRLSLDVDEKYQNLVGLVAPLPGRLSATEDGLQGLVEALPKEIQRRYWTGFNDAVREGYAETGTDGTGRHRPPRLGLVQPPEDPDDDGA